MEPPARTKAFESFSDDPNVMRTSEDHLSIYSVKSIKAIKVCRLYGTFKTSWSCRQREVHAEVAMHYFSTVSSAAPMEAVRQLAQQLRDKYHRAHPLRQQKFSRTVARPSVRLTHSLTQSASPASAHPPSRDAPQLSSPDRRHCQIRHHPLPA